MERRPYTPTETIKRLEVNVPAQLRELPNWVLWKYEGQPGEKPKKPPFSTDGKRASVSNPQSWTNFTEALRTYTQWGGYEGLGLMLTQGLTVIDLDNCLDTEKTPNQQAQQIIRATNSYTEVSPSGKGLHILLFGDIPGTARRRGSIEMYDTARYITVTGQRLPGTPAEIRRSEETIKQIHTRFIRPPDATKSPARAIYQPQALSHDQIIKKAHDAKNGAKFSRLWAGDTTLHESPSEAHLALFAMLLYWTNGDTNKAEDLFKESGQFDNETAQKWDERHSTDGKTYGQITIDKALATKQIFTQRNPKRS
jgi:primase-polymerase (primpol)-like protein